MDVMRMVRTLLVAAATLSVAVPQMAQAGQPTSTASRPVIQGGAVSVDAQGVLLGALVDASGHGVPEAAVAVVQGGRLLLNAKTDKTGKFRASGVTPGKLMVVTNHTLHQFQAVSGDEAAGPEVKKGVIIAVDPEVARGSFGGVSAGLIGTLLVAGVVAGIIIAADDDDDAS